MRTTAPSVLHARRADTEMSYCECFERAVALYTHATFANESLGAQATLAAPQLDLAGRI